MWQRKPKNSSRSPTTNTNVGSFRLKFFGSWHRKSKIETDPFRKYGTSRIFATTRRWYLRLAVKITVAHDNTKAAVKQAVNRALDDLVTGSVSLPVKLVQESRTWNADTLRFSLIARMGPMGLMSTPISGTVRVTDHDLYIDVNLGVLERLIPAEKARHLLTKRLAGLLTWTWPVKKARRASRVIVPRALARSTTRPSTLGFLFLSVFAAILPTRI